MGTRQAARGWGSVLLMCGVGMGCAASATSPRAEHPSGPAPRDTRILHEECPVEDSGVVAEDVNGDGRPDRRTVMDGGRVVCRGLDFNFDGVVDAWVYFDETGKVRRRESDYDRDGRVDEVAI